MTADSPSVAVVQRVADTMGRQPTDLPERLYEAVDPEALDTVLASGDEDVTVRFNFCGFWVRVSGDGTVALDEH